MKRLEKILIGAGITALVLGSLYYFAKEPIKEFLSNYGTEIRIYHVDVDPAEPDGPTETRGREGR